MRRVGHLFGVIGAVACLSIYGTGCASRSALKAEQEARRKAEEEVRRKAEEARKAQDEVARLKAELKEVKKAAEDAAMAAQQAARALEEVPRASLMLEDIHFGFDSPRLDEEAKAKLTQHVFALVQHPDMKVIIEGYSDERGSAEYNLALGKRRALHVKEFLVEAGVDESRIIAVSYGEKWPLDPGHNEKAWAKNRRVELLVNP